MSIPARFASLGELRSPATGSVADASTIASPANRDAALDLFRGCTVAAMLFVNNPGDWNHVYGPLTHADWHGWTCADLIFPSFLFIVGTSAVLSLDRLALQALWRGLRIAAIGWVIAAFPFTLERIVHLRIPGVLPRIGIVFFIGVWILLAVRRPVWILAAIAILLAVHSFLLTGTGWDLTPEHNLQLAVDRALLGDHLWQDGGDPEGIVSTLSATATMLTGALAGYALLSKADRPTKMLWLLLGGTLAMVAGEIWGQTLPINKHLWTGSFVLLTSGAAAVLLAASMWTVDLERGQRLLKAFSTFGKNPLAAFVLSELLSDTLHFVRWRLPSGRAISLRAFLFAHGFGWTHHPTIASHLFALTVVLLWYLVLRGFETRGWFWKI
jgi:predicted acyltransferase